MSANNPHEMQVRVAKLFERLSVVASGPQIPDDELDPRLRELRAHNYPDNRQIFSCFKPSHLEKAEELYKIFYLANDFEDLIHLASQARTFVNSTMFAFSFEVAFLHKKEYHGIALPPIQEVFADRFVPATSFVEAFTIANARQPGDESPVIVDVVATGNIRDPEYKLAYYREDVGINAHHWHWHIVYPSTYDPEFFGAAKDRKGELFYYMHQQMCARYDCERLSNGLECMIPFNDFKDVLEGYAAHLLHVASGRSYASRPDGQTLKDLKGEFDVSVQDMKRWIRYIYDSIDLGIVINEQGQGIEIDINNLGAIVESSKESVNRSFYGNLHNAFHVMVAYIHDSDGRFKETPGVMTDTAAALRDPIFYRFHRSIDNVFNDYKETLTPYSRDQLDFKDVDLTDVTLDAKTPNVIHTFMREDELELNHTVHFGTPESVRARYHHLDHECFSYIIKCQNNANVAKESTVRIFLAPTHDEKGNHIPLNNQRRLYIEMDKFHFKLQPGKNTIVRSSIHSSVTISNTYTFRQVIDGDNLHENKDEFCSCGWPQHLLVPKGNEKGMEFDLFVMLTDAETDSVESDGNLCSDALSYCGVLDQKYPDMKAMGYPFDRKIVDDEHFLTHNMRVSHIKVQFQE